MMSYNLKDGQYNSNSAQQRKSSLANVVKGQDPDIVCLQELGTSTDYSHFKADAFASECNNRSYGSYQQGTTAVMWDSALYTNLTGGVIDCTIAVADGGDSYT
ncbi:MAG: hypothetical protein II955_03175, partial [Clostridia bacterium]|nr:hypothetical protein [Clostridia bacterium]